MRIFFGSLAVFALKNASSYTRPSWGHTWSTVEIFHKNERDWHKRSNKEGGHTTCKEHMPKSHQAYLEWTPSRIINWGKKTGDLIRDIKYLTTLPDKATVFYGETLLEAVREMFGIIHKRETMNEETFRALLNNARQDILLKGMRNVPGTTKEAQNLAKRFRLHGNAYFRFITTPGVEPTNNLAEQAIRFVVIDRVITQGTRSKEGRTWCERIWTVLATCSNQAYSAFEFIYKAVKAHFNPEQPIPSLLLNSS